MDTKIKEVENYFKGKLVDGDYTIKKVDLHSIFVIIDGEYEFVLWIANGEKLLSCNFGAYFSFMDLEFTDNEKALIWKHLEKDIQENAIKLRQEQIGKLNKEINELSK